MSRKPLDVLNVIGHDLAGNAGAKGQGIPERYEMGAWVPSFVRAQRAVDLKAGTDMRRVEVTPYDARYDDLVNRCIERNPRALVDYHFNSGGYPGVTGLYPPGNMVAKQLCESACRALAEAQNTKYRGVRDSAGEDGRPRAWTGNETVSADGNWYPAGPPLLLLELPAPIIPIVIEFFDGSVKSDHDAAMASFRAGRSQAALARVIAEFLASVDGGGPSLG